VPNYTRRRKIIYVAPTDRQLLDALNRTWEAIQARPLGIEGGAVPDVSISLQPRAASNCNSVEWDSRLPAIILNLIDPEKDRGRKAVKSDGEIVGYKLSGAEVVAWLAHLAAHGVKPRPADEAGHTPGAFTTSAGAEGFFHPSLYAEAASALGLNVTQTQARGWSETRLRHGEYTEQIKDLQAALDQWKPVVQRKYDRGPFSVTCKCSPENNGKPVKLFRASVGVLRSSGIAIPDEQPTRPDVAITCADCGSPLTYREPPTRRKASRLS
jgi:hypothetical protein